MPTVSTTAAAAAYQQSLEALTPLQIALVEDEDFVLTDHMPASVCRARELFVVWQAATKAA